MENTIAWSRRVELAACYRLAQRNGWDEPIYNHISARVPGPQHHFLNPFRLAFEEVTAYHRPRRQNGWWRGICLASDVASPKPRGRFI